MNNSADPLNASGAGNTANGNDYFGRSTGLAGASKAKTSEEQKYVNLNPETAFGPEVITSFDFPNSTLLDLTKHMQKLTGLNIILDKEVKGKVSIMAPSPITVGDAWKAYLTVLNLNGYTLVKSGAFYQIVATRDIRYTPTNIYTGAFTPDTDNYIMKIVPIKHIDVTEIARSFRPFMSRYGRLIDIKQTNTIIVHDTGSNIHRLMKLIKFLDVPGHEESLHIIKVQHSSAQEIAKLLDTILKGKDTKRFTGAATTKKSGDEISRIIAEPRTNSIIAMATSAGAVELNNLVKKLDVKLVSSGSGRIHVYYLNYGDSKSLAKTLSELVGSGNNAAKGGAQTRIATRNQLQGQSNDSELFSADVKITADEENNALVVTASPTDWLTLENVINKLDIPRDQVYVEGMIMETQVNKDDSFGISLLGAYGSGNAQKAGFTGGNSDLVNLLTNNITQLSGFFVGAGVGKKVELDVGGNKISVNSVNGLISAIAADNRTNVLATPQILALDNKEAIFEVGESVPVPKSTDSASGATTTSIDQQKVALTLKITPQINKVTRFIRLDIDQKIEDFSGRAVSSQGGVATTLRSAKTNVVVRDRDTIAMGGLMRDKETDSINKVPLLGDIPVLGWLFKRKSKTHEKVNLLFFLTPKIVAPYEKIAAAHVKESANRRSAHLKNSLGEDDFHNSTMKGLYEKADKQSAGPLYDLEDASKYLKQNKSYTAPGGAPYLGTDDEEEKALKAQGNINPLNQLNQNNQDDMDDLILDESQSTSPLFDDQSPTPPSSN
jgi:general secretion pathway protein D